jgi:hypothetical protein
MVGMYEREVARISHRADTAEQECLELRKKPHMAEVRLTIDTM